MIINVGVDLHKHQFTVYFLYDNGEGSHEKYSAENTGINQFIKKLKGFKTIGYKINIAVESTGNTRYFRDCLEKEEFSVKIINTRKFKVVSESVNKSDKRDAKTIAEFLSKDMLPEVNLCSRKSEQLRRLLSTREILIRSNVRLKNQAHGIMMSFGYTTNAGLFSTKKGRSYAISLIDNSTDKMILEQIFNAIETNLVNIEAVTKVIDEETKDDKAVKLLKTIPGTGLIIATTVRAYIDDVSKFKVYTHLSSYSGLAPFMRQSDQKEYHGSITKGGPKQLRTAFVQMTMGVLRSKEMTETRYRLKYGFMKKSKGSGKSIIATARKLTKMVWTMLMREEPYDCAKARAEYLPAKAQTAA